MNGHGDNPTLEDALAGDGAALQRLLTKLMPKVERAAPTYMGPDLRRSCRTSDLVQSALLEAVESMKSFRGGTEAELLNWTVRILEHNARDRRRRLRTGKRDIERERAGDQCSLETAPHDEPSPSQLAIEREQLVRMARAIRRLPRDQRRILQLTALRGSSHADAAALMARSEGACRVLLARARASLLIEMARDDVDDA
ncbi:MAG: RNA polymerase sigma factor [Planctomycetota bacterium]